MTHPARNTEWFSKARWGVFCHWLGAPPSSDEGAELTAEAWNDRVDAFDVGGLANQLASVGAPYFFITAGQNSGHYIAPNATYDRHVGIEPSKCSRRDLVSDLYDALSSRGIELLVYLPAHPPAAEPIAVERLGWEWGFKGGWPQSWNTERTGKRLASCQVKWEEIIRDWSMRWGRKVRGWWVDGCYFADEMYRHEDAPNFASLTAAYKAGNPDSIIAYNPGIFAPVICHTEFDDYTAGEVADALPAEPADWVARGTHRARAHVLSYLGKFWCQGAPRFSDRLASEYSRHYTSLGGVISWDVPILESGLIPEPFVRQLARIGGDMKSTSA